MTSTPSDLLIGVRHLPVTCASATLFHTSGSGTPAVRDRYGLRSVERQPGSPDLYPITPLAPDSGMLAQALNVSNSVKLDDGPGRAVGTRSMNPPRLTGARPRSERAAKRWTGRPPQWVVVDLDVAVEAEVHRRSADMPGRRDALGEDLVPRHVDVHFVRRLAFPGCRVVLEVVRVAARVLDPEFERTAAGLRLGLGLRATVEARDLVADPLQESVEVIKRQHVVAGGYVLHDPTRPTISDRDVGNDGAGPVERHLAADHETGLIGCTSIL